MNQTVQTVGANNSIYLEPIAPKRKNLFSWVLSFVFKDKPTEGCISINSKEYNIKLIIDTLSNKITYSYLYRL